MAQDNISVRVRAVGLDKDVANLARKGEALAAPVNLTLNPKGFVQPLGRITGKMGEFEKSMDAAAARVFAFGAAVGVINAVANALKSMAQNAVEVQKALTDINVVMGLTEDSLAGFGEQLFDIAQNTATPFDQVTEAAVEFARQGLSAEETLQRINDAMILTRLSGLDAAQSVAALTAAINGFNTSALSSTDIVNRLATVDAAFAVSSKDLADGLARAGATAQAAKVNFNELLAAVTSVQQQTARGGAVIGNSFNSIFTRMQRSSVQDAFNELGVATQDSEGNFRSSMDVLQDYANVYSSLTDAQRAHTDELIAGVFQVNNLKALIKDLNSEYSIYSRALETANGATDEATKRNEQLNKTMAAVFSQTGLAVKEMAAALGDLTLGPGMEKVLNMVKGIADAINNLIGEEDGSEIAKGLMRGIGSFISGPGLVIIGAAFLKLFAFIAKQGAGALKSVFALNTETKRQEGLQAAIGQILTSNERVMKLMLSDSVSQAEKERQILAILKQQTTERMAQDAFLKKMAASSALANIGVAKSGFIGPWGTGNRAARGAKDLGIAAGGYIPSFAKEQKEINRGTGGASKSAKPVLIKNFKSSKGKTEDIVANTDEYIVNNYMGTGASAIFNRDMVSRLGMPIGAEKIRPNGHTASNVAFTASSGSIPNFASKSWAQKKKDKMDKAANSASPTLTLRARRKGLVLPMTGSTQVGVRETMPVSSVLKGKKPNELQNIAVTGLGIGYLASSGSTNFDEMMDQHITGGIRKMSAELFGQPLPNVSREGLNSYLDRSAKPQVVGRLFEASLNYIGNNITKNDPGNETWDFPSRVISHRLSNIFNMIKNVTLWVVFSRLRNILQLI